MSRIAFDIPAEVMDALRDHAEAFDVWVERLKAAGSVTRFECLVCRADAIVTDRPDGSRSVDCQSCGWCATRGGQRAN